MEVAVPIEDATDTHREWLTRQHHLAAQRFDGELVGPRLFGWHDRTIGAQVVTPDGPRWLRVTSEPPQWARGDSWTGNHDATSNTFAGVPKPELLDQREWSVGDLRVRADLMSCARHGDRRRHDPAQQR